MEENLEGLSRREFLKAAGVAAASLIIPSNALGFGDKEIESMRKKLAYRISLSSGDESLKEAVLKTAMRMMTQTNPPYTIPYRGGRYSLEDTFSRISRFRDYIKSNSYLTYNNKHITIENLANSFFAQESAADERVTSGSGARGFAQLMPATARELGLRVDKYVDHRLDPEISIETGLEYLKRQIRKNPNDGRLSLIAYNAGPGIAEYLVLRGFNTLPWDKLKKKLPQKRKKHREETIEFVEKILAMQAILDTELIKPKNLPLYSQNFSTYFVSGKINLRKIAERNKINFRKMREWNLHFLAEEIYSERRVEKVKIPFV
ncbi:transglycosylase SLT domain-containing protein [Candidatus Pacearchaeota archaeon]|nr:transglycosylase SLT domain-containing protein [Candidatus Pacearchaeota archaeon]